MNSSQVASKQVQSSLPDGLSDAVHTLLETWRTERTIARVWQTDASVWTDSGEQNWLGWLHVMQKDRRDETGLRELSAWVRQRGFTDAVLLGMGGSSLCADVLQSTFGRLDGYPRLRVLDSTDPQQIGTIAKAADLPNTLFIVASKSGSTLEPNLLMQYFLARQAEIVGETNVGDHFIAITDPGSALERTARERKFSRVFLSDPKIGGRYSALSPFGMVPAAVMGLDVHRLYERAEQMATACAEPDAPGDNPGAWLGAVLGCAATIGRDKLTVLASESIARLGAWLEQLVAESIGKAGRAIIPVDGEQLAKPRLYGDDRLFVSIEIADQPDADIARQLEDLANSGYPVIRIRLADAYDLSAEFFRWEFATAMAGAVMAINPFDQPDVEASKQATKKLTQQIEREGALPQAKPAATFGNLSVYPAHAVNELTATGQSDSLSGFIKWFLGLVGAGDYVALLAYLEQCEATEHALGRIRHLIRNQFNAATCVGFGPRFLHSTGQAYKGGPNTGVFLQITADDPQDIAVPDSKLTFGAVKSAQALGDFQVLDERNRRAIRIHIHGELSEGLTALEQSIRDACVSP